ncbi:class III extradiol dioxygenase subunit B-like domain-containing protein [Pseudobacteriovorax antillogorgiicola]|uniref:AmmeMemoRadiSam system protein B n=1 Tax=Pseudobacteriovorax antillogorgiicola TaxID=1513793 RepID=A0A1Y6CE16_9BACT|nr:class III extradiol dioxygenase subunit B-like domain-containing protein [Pseudobacteriovorax antillogorgiicola]TCS48325.1 AmmeMemoRadiSam system protein B [Pseudobacteriovorax antillogorgiicola]SMF56549.1 AmmeMemoRadiSam system protein B [Pseudobacteriovorax antillogorgiicola]
MPICSSALMCHAPVTIPTVGLDRSKQCGKTTDSMMTAARTLMKYNPDHIILVSPHAPRLPDKFGVINQRITGNFASFGKPGIKINLPWDKVMIEELEDTAPHSFESLPKVDLDHGSMVPLWFLQQAGWDGKTTIISLPAMEPMNYVEDAADALHDLLRKDPQSFALVASGDLSHCLRPDSPGGFHPQAEEFDQNFTQALHQGDFQKAIQISEDLRMGAGEDVVDSFCFVALASQLSNHNAKFLSYEAPFGVGYGISILNQFEPDD